MPLPGIGMPLEAGDQIYNRLLFIFGVEIGQLESKGFFAAVTVMMDKGIVHGQHFECFSLVDEHGCGILIKEVTVSLLAILQIDIALSQFPCARSYLLFQDKTSHQAHEQYNTQRKAKYSQP